MRIFVPQSPPAGPESERSELAGKIQWLMFFRVLMISVLLGSTLAFNPEEIGDLSDPAQAFFLGLIVVTYVLTLVYAVALPRVRNLPFFAHLQLSGDVLLMSALVIGTGGTESVFTFIFSLTIINGAIILYRRGALITATTSSVAFLGLVLIERQVMSSGGLPWRSEILGGSSNVYYVTYVHIASFYLVALLSSYLSEKLRTAGRRLRAQAVDIERARALNENIARSIASGLVSVHQRRIIYFNPSAERITGLRASAVVQQPIDKVLPGLRIAGTPPPRSVQGEGEEFPPAEVRARTLDRHEVGFVRPDGTAITLGYRTSKLKSPDGATEGQLVVFEDITTIRRLEDAIRRSQRLAATGELAAGIAHELRNPLASISGSAQLLAGEAPAEGESRVLLDIIQREAERLERLVSDFLDFARPPRTRHQAVDLGETVWMTVRLFESTPAFAHCAVGTDGVPAGLKVEADPDQLKQVLWNLLANAGQALDGVPDARIDLSAQAVSLPGAEPGPRWVRIQVEDNGPGVPEELRARVFDPFFTTRPHGTGLGLSVVHRIAEEHGGFAEIDASPSGGACIALVLRRAAFLDAGAAAAGATSKASPGTGEED